MLTFWIVYKNPSDYPNQYVLRALDVINGVRIFREDCIVEESYLKIYLQIPKGLTRLPPFEGDDPAIYEMWI